MAKYDKVQIAILLPSEHAVLQIDASVGVLEAILLGLNNAGGCDLWTFMSLPCPYGAFYIFCKDGFDETYFIFLY